MCRVQHGALDGIRDPKLAVVLIGTNNIGNSGHSADAVACGIHLLLRTLLLKSQEKQTGTQEEIEVEVDPQMKAMTTKAETTKAQRKRKRKMKILLLAVLPRGRGQSRSATTGATRHGAEIMKLNTLIRKYVDDINSASGGRVRDSNGAGAAAATVVDGERSVFYLDTSQQFLDRDELLYKTKAAASVAAQYYQEDSLHLNARGYDVLAKAIAPMVQEILG